MAPWAAKQVPVESPECPYRQVMSPQNSAAEAASAWEELLVSELAAAGLTQGRENLSTNSEPEPRETAASDATFPVPGTSPAPGPDEAAVIALLPFAAVADPSKPTEGAQLLSRLVAWFPDDVKQPLRRLLSHDLAVPTPGAARQLRLGLLMDMVSAGTGEVPRVDDYEEERARRSKQGEKFPAHSTLHEHYGSWVSAVAAAMALVWRGSAARVPASRKTQRSHSASYTRAEVIAALTEARNVLGGWPDEQVFFDYNTVERELRRMHGDTGPRLPTRGPIRRLFGDFSTALTAAQRLEAGS